MVLGDEHVGKTCITNRLVQKPFNQHEPSTDGIVISKLCRIKPNDTWTVIPKEEGQAKQLHDEALIESFINTSLKSKKITQDTGTDSSTGKAKQLHNEALIESFMDTSLKSKKITQDTGTDSSTDKEKTSLGKLSSEVKETYSETRDTIGLEISPSRSQDLPEHLEDVEENKDVRHKKKRVEMSTSLRTQEKDQKKEIEKMNRELTLPDGFVESVLKYSSKMKQDRGNELSVKIYDFAGQKVYASTHQVFLASRAVYILAFNLLDDLDSNLKHEHVHYNYLTLLNWIINPFKKVKLKETNLERLHFWLQSIHANGKVSGQAADQQQLSPPIFIVGTHMNKLSGNKTKREQKLKEIEEKIFSSLKDTPYERHVVTKLFAVENSLDEDNGISELRSHLEKVCLGEPYMDFLTPVTWLKLLADLEEKRNEGKHCLKLEEVKALAEECKIKGSVHIVLNFFQDIGEVVYFGREEDPDGNLLKENIILDPQWLVDLFRTIITHINFDEQHADYKDSWRRLKKEGILQERLADRLWKDVGVSKEFLFEIMKKFYLICEKIRSEKDVGSESSEAGRLFLVPCLFKDFECESPKLVEKRFPMIRFYIDFQGFLPSGLFHKALVRIIAWSQDQGGRDLPLYRKRGEFYVDHAHDMILQLSPLNKSTVEVMILRVDGKAQDPCKRICRKVYQLLKDCFGDICTIWAKGLNYQFAIACDQCNSDKPHLHPFEDCQKPKVPCTQSKRMDVTKYQESFLKEYHESTCPDCSLCGSDQSPARPIAQKEDFKKAAQVSTLGFAVDESVFPRVLLTVSQSIGTDLNIWKVALKDEIKNANTVHKAAEATELFNALRDTAILKADDISILLETINLTSVLHLQKHIPNCPRLDNIKITHFSKFRQSVMTFGLQLIDHDIRLIAQRYELPGQYSDKWSLIMDLENNLILADDDKLLDDFKHTLDKLGLRRLCRLLYSDRSPASPIGL
ncbi:uncharacterized protein LOC117103038 isoform X2 [Anneissia japonica]|uniref:uncharacterized protein LOC117103038 isoform X2 n=1 Tax=Anneissia japonica TaxID=1529436 RepID=UPI0014259B02|nr:uncharacterized protein LOC117103038 isoform X2 [Anneissia japonica]